MEGARGDLTADVATPAGTSVALSVRTGNTPTPDGTWTDWQSLPDKGGNVGATSAYLQYRAELTTTDDSATPELREVEVEYQLTGPPPPTGLFSMTWRVGNLAARRPSTAQP